MKRIMKLITISIVTFFFLLGTLLTIRFLFGGPEDDWICVGGQWVKHGHPAAPMPERECGK